MAGSSARAVGEALDLALARPRGAAAIALVSLIAALIAATVNVVAAALVVATLFVVLVALAGYAIRQRSLFEGPYQVLEDHTTWDLQDPDAATAVVTKRLRVRFNYPCIAIVD